jgi:hypothetical protein
MKLLNAKKRIQGECRTPLMEVKFIQYTSFYNKIYLDTEATGLFAEGTKFPSGNQMFPVNNLDDAIEVSHSCGIPIIHVLGHVNIKSHHTVCGMEFLGDGPDKSHIIFEEGARTTDCVFDNLHISGKLGHSACFNRCIIDINIDKNETTKRQ